jgi:hypothetical protein
VHLTYAPFSCLLRGLAAPACFRKPRRQIVGAQEAGGEVIRLPLNFRKFPAAADPSRDPWGRTEAGPADLRREGSEEVRFFLLEPLGYRTGRESAVVPWGPREACLSRPGMKLKAPTPKGPVGPCLGTVLWHPQRYPTKGTDPKLGPVALPSWDGNVKTVWVLGARLPGRRVREVPGPSIRPQRRIPETPRISFGQGRCPACSGEEVHLVLPEGRRSARTGEEVHLVPPEGRCLARSGAEAHLVPPEGRCLARSGKEAQLVPLEG